MHANSQFAPRSVFDHDRLGALQVAVRVNVPSTGISLAEDVYGPFSGQVTSAARQAMRRAVLEAHARLVEAMFLCEVSSTAEVLSGVWKQAHSCRVACSHALPAVQAPFLPHMTADWLALLQPQKVHTGIAHTAGTVCICGIQDDAKELSSLASGTYA